MSKKIGTIQRKSRGTSAKSFFFGSFVGFILCLALLAGAGCFAYFKVSPYWLNKTFKTDIDLGNDEINKKTLRDYVNGAIGLAQNIDTYTLADLKEDFGIEIKNEMFGLDITELKSVGISELPDAIKEKFSSISADELRNVISLDDMSKILNKKNTYYYNSVDNKLYKNFDGTNYTNEVTFKYAVSSDKTKITTKNHETTITLNSKYGKLNQVNIELWYLPLTVAIADFSSSIGSNTTLKELKDDYGVDLPAYITKEENLNKTINELTTIVNNLYIADILEYTLDKTNDTTLNQTDLSKWIVKDKSGNVVNGAIKEIAKLKIGEISNNTQSTINGLYIADVLEYTIDKSYDTTVDKSDSSKWIIKDKNGKQVTGVLAKIADLQIGNMTTGIQNKIDTMTIAEVLSYTKATTPSEFYFIDANKNGMYDNGEEKISGVMATLADATINNVSDKIPEVKIKDVLSYTYDKTGKFYFEDVNSNGEYDAGDIKTTGIMANLVDLKVSEIANKVAELKIGDALGFYYDETDQKFYQDSSKTEITGMLSVFVDLTIQDLNEATLKTQVNKLSISDVFENTSSGILSLIPAETKINGIATALESVIANTNLYTLQLKGVINAEKTDLDKSIGGKVLGEMKLQEMIDYIIDLAY